ncbi:hypothetical protein CC2G_008248 [Coprinopsis cinerea AmutBmut pab1-1]|nr:hypothetical protein CC2G_008248 [Coprinopsis cinerea AmutBmut pab1-1]
MSAATSLAAATIRAVSPLAHAMLVDNDHDTASLRRHAAVMAVSTLEELLALVPTNYRECLREAIYRYAEIAKKRFNARTTLAKWQDHATNSTLPTHLSSKVPEIQVSKEFRADKACTEALVALESRHSAYLKEVLANEIKIKADDVDFLDHLLKPEVTQEELFKLASARSAELLATQQTPVFAKNDQGQVTITGWVPNQALIKERDAVLQDLTVWAYKAILIVEQREGAAKRIKDKKKELAKSADVTMGDVKPGPSLQSVIDKSVSKIVKAQIKNLAGSSKKNTLQKKKSSGKQKVVKVGERYPSPPLPRLPPPRGKSNKPQNPRGKGEKRPKTSNTGPSKPKKGAKGKGKAN